MAHILLKQYISFHSTLQLNESGKRTLCGLPTLNLIKIRINHLKLTVAFIYISEVIFFIKFIYSPYNLEMNVFCLIHRQ